MTYTEFNIRMIIGYFFVIIMVIFTYFILLRYYKKKNNVKKLRIYKCVALPFLFLMIILSIYITSSSFASKDDEWITIEVTAVIYDSGLKGSQFIDSYSVCGITNDKEFSYLVEFFASRDFKNKIGNLMVGDYIRIKCAGDRSIYDFEYI